MDMKIMLLSQRNSILKKYGFDISYEQSELSDYKYTIRKGDFAVYVYRDNKDEVDTLSQIITYIDSAPHKTALGEVKAYENCLNIVHEELSSYGRNISKSKAFLEIRKLLREARKVDLEKELAALGIQNINSLHCTNVLGLEDAKSELAELYIGLAFLKQSAEQQGLNYDEAENGIQKI